MASSHTLDQLDSCFDDTHAVANTGLLLAATLAERLDIEQAADQLIDRGDRLIVRRTRLVGEQAELFPNWRYHGFVTDRVGAAVWLDQDRRRHATVELCIRDHKGRRRPATAPRASSAPTPPGC